MKIYADKEFLYELKDTDLKILLNDIHDKDLLHHIKHLIRHVLETKINNCKKRLLLEWSRKIKVNGGKVPSGEDAFLTYIFEHPDYKKRSERQSPVPKNIKNFKS